MLHRRPLALLLLLFLSLVFSFSPACAQIKSGNVHVLVTYPDDRAPTAQLKVGLIGSGNQVAETYTNDHGQAQFWNVVSATISFRSAAQEYKLRQVKCLKWIPAGIPNPFLSE